VLSGNLLPRDAAAGRCSLLLLLLLLLRLLLACCRQMNRSSRAAAIAQRLPRPANRVRMTQHAAFQQYGVGVSAS